MGGKAKQAQRTKNNVRPSSSGRSAELLVGGGAVGAATLFPGLAATAAPALDLPPTFALAIKKLNKKDPITKTKALQELNELVQNSEVDDVVGILPSWVHFYKALSVDPDRKVREATQMCHGSIVSTCGRRVAPVLRALLPTWLTAQYDDYAPAQSLAQHSLSNTFPDNKLPEAIAFCKTEVFSHILDSLLNSEAVISKKMESAEERSAGVCRVCAGALGGLQFAAQRLPPALADWALLQLTPLLQAHAFWKLANHDNYTVRCAWYSCVGALGARWGGAWGALCGARALRALLAAAAPAAPRALWAALLQLLHHDPEWPSRLERRELVARRVLELARGGRGGDLLLPLLAQLPPQATPAGYYADFLRATVSGLDKIVGSRIEQQAWITTVAECVRYVSVQGAGEGKGEGCEGDSGGACEGEGARAVAAAVRQWLAAVLRARDVSTRLALARHSAFQLAKLIKYWLQLSEEDKSGRYDKLVRSSWQAVCAAITAAPGPPAPPAAPPGPPAPPDAPPTDDADAGDQPPYEAIHALLYTLKIALTQEPKKPQSIKFADEEPPMLPPPVPGPAPPAPPAPPAGLAARYSHQLQHTVQCACAGLLERGGARAAGGLLPTLTEFDSPELWHALAASLGAASPAGLYWRVVRRWLPARGALRLALLLLRHLPPPDQDRVYDSFHELPADAQVWCVSMCCSQPAGAAGAAGRWLRGGGGAALAGAARAAARGDAPARAALTAALHADTPTERLVSDETMSRILEVVSESLEEAGAGGGGGQGEAGHLPAAVSLAALLVTCAAPAPAAAPSAAPAAPPPHYTRLLTALYTLALTHTSGGGGGGGASVPAAACETARAAVGAGLQALPAPTAARLRDHYIRDMHTHLHDQSEALDMSCIERCALLIPHLKPREGGDTAAVDTYQSLVSCDDVTSLRAAVETHALAAACVRGDLYCPLVDEDDSSPIRQVVDQALSAPAPPPGRGALGRWARHAALRQAALSALGAPFERPLPARLLDALVDLLYDYAIARSMQRTFTFWSEYSTIETLVTHLSATLEPVCRAEAGGLRAALAGRAARAGYLWPYARAHAARLAQGRAAARTHTTPTDDSMNNDVEDTKTSEPTEKTSEPDEKMTKLVETVTESAENLPESPDKASVLSTQMTESAENVTESEDTMDSDFDIDFSTVEDIMTGNGYFHSLQALWSVREEERQLSESEQDSALQAAIAVAWRALGAALGPRAPQPGPRRPQLDDIIDTYYANQDCMLYDTDLSGASWARATGAAAACCACARAVTSRGWELAAHHWDFINISITSLLASMQRAKHHWDTTQVAMVSVSVLRLLACAERFVGAVRGLSERRQPRAHVAALPAEWADVFQPAAAAALQALATHILETDGKKREVSASGARVLAELTRAMQRMRWAGGAAGGAGGAAGGAGGAARACAGALAAPAHPAYKYLAYYTLRALADPLAEEDAQKLAAWSAVSEEEARAAAPEFALGYFHSALTHLQDVVDAALTHLQVGEETCCVVPGTDAHSLALGWLLLVVALCDATRQHSDLQHHYIELFRKHKYTERLVPSALRLLPATLAQFAAEHRPAPPPPLHYLFTTTKQFTIDEPPCAEDVSSLACRALFVGVSGVCAGGARGWWGAAGGAARRALARLVAAYVAPPLVRAQLQAVHRQRDSLPDTQIIVHWTSNEVECILNLDDKNLELRVWLARDHPLSLPKIQGPRSVGAGNTQWLAMFLAYQNGSLLAALRMWRAALLARVAAAPHCYICYCRLHPNTARLPSVPCHQCHNKFHNECLRKWFTTSNKSNCPLCRATF